MDPATAAVIARSKGMARWYKSYWTPKRPKPVPGLGHVRIWSLDPPCDVLALLAEERPNVEAGYGGWEEVARPRRRPLTSWNGLPGLRLTLPILLDGWASEQVQEKAIGQLEQMATSTSSDGEPPLVYIHSPGGAVPHQNKIWVVTDLTWGDALMNEKGDRTRQAVTLGLLEYVADVYITERSAARRQRLKAAAAKQKPNAGSKRVTAHHAKKASGKKTRAAVVSDFGAGEDLLSLAARELGDANRWLEIALLNDIRDPRSIRPGQVIRLP